MLPLFVFAQLVVESYQTIYKLEPYMYRQEDINARMRAILIDWLVEVHMKFRLVPETLYLCVSIIDRYCSKVDVLRSKLQLIGVTALLVACKHEEIYPPEVRDCVYITDRAYNRQEVLDMEQDILKVLDWRISVPVLIVPNIVLVEEVFYPLHPVRGRRSDDKTDKSTLIGVESRLE